MPGINGDIVGQRGQFPERLCKNASVAARQVGATAGSFEKGVAGEDDFFLLKVVADASFGVAGSFQTLKTQISNCPMFSSFRLDESGSGFSRDRVVGLNLVLLAEGPFEIFGVDVKGRGAGGVQVGEGAKVIGMTVGEQVGGDS